MSDSDATTRSNAVLVLGGGIAGIKASLDLAEAGRRVYLVDKKPALGGFLPFLDRQFPTNDCNICLVTPDLAKAGAPLDILSLPLTRLEALNGQAGDFSATLVTEPRCIDVNKCNACGACLTACPEGAVRFTPGLDHSSPTCLRYPQAVPTAFSIDLAKCTRCGKCLEVCEPDAIDLDMAPATRSVSVGSVIVASGAELFDPTSMQEWYGYGKFPDVVTSLEFEQIMSAAGPTGGEFMRPSDGRRPRRIGWIQCVGSRSTKAPAKPYCSSICCMFAMKEAVWAKEHYAQDLDATVFFMDMRPMGKDYEQYYQRVKNEQGINFVRCRPHTVGRDAESGDMLLEYASEDGTSQVAHLDLVVLATGFCAPGDAAEQAQALGIELDPYAFVAAPDFDPLATSRPGVYACGMALGPKDIPDSLVQAAGAACLAGQNLAPASPLMSEDALPAEMDSKGEDARVGVFFADWSGRVSQAVDLKLVMEAAGHMPGVVHVDQIVISGGREGLDRLVETIKAQKLNRVVVAGYSPRTHGRLFAETVRRAGLNRAMVELANIRDQVAMVHADDPAHATAKAVELVRMAVAGVLLAQPVFSHNQPMGKAALVVGGGVAGLTTALALASQGIKVHLVERAKELGGLALKLKRTLDGQPLIQQVHDLVDQVQAHPGINVITDALVVDNEGQVGAFRTGVQSGPSMYYQKLEHGVTVLATGAREYRPEGYYYGQDPRVLTQLDLEDMLAQGDGADDRLDSVVMIQCVGSRNAVNPACGRICCQNAVKNALWIKDLKPEAQVIVLYRDMRTPYRAEDAYREAREKGVLFVRFSEDDPPVVTKDDDGLLVSFTDKVLGRRLAYAPNALVLSTPQVADDEAMEELCQIFKLQQTDTGFLLEENVKVRPVDTPAPGVFAAGSILAPKSIAESRAQGLAAAGRALTLLAQQSLNVSGAVAKVLPERCAACLVCVRACPAGVPFINADGYSQIDPAKCQGCGICAAECPAKAIQLAGFSDDQILGRTDALLEGVL
ncbi:MAG: FAD-dependent oxidoreductase [Pseudomonadota bacterium]